MYWADGGHNTIGLTGSDTTWFLAEGFTGAGFNTFILLQNPNPDPANVTVTYMLDDGSNLTRSRSRSGFRHTSGQRYAHHRRTRHVLDWRWA